MPGKVDHNYMLTQIRYLGVFQTIQIRQKTFPARKSYADFIATFQPIFKNAKGKVNKQAVDSILADAKAR